MNKKSIGWGNLYLIDNNYVFEEGLYGSREAGEMRKHDYNYIDTIEIIVDIEKLNSIKKEPDLNFKYGSVRL